MADEYICKQDAVDALDRIFDNVPMELTTEILRLRRELRGLSPADVAPVVHGKWMKEDRGHVEYCAVCDQCGFDWMWSDRGYFKFCPNCGAKMRGVQDE